MKQTVHSHSGFRYAEKPVSFEWEGDEHKIKDIIAEWKTEYDLCFKVVTEGGFVFELNYNERLDEWQVKPIHT